MLRKKAPRTPIIVTSACLEPSVQGILEGLSNVSFLEKPVDLELLKAEMAKKLESKEKPRGKHSSQPLS